MVDVKVCSKCGASIPGQAIIAGEARLVNGQLVCAGCGQASAAPAAPQAAAVPAPAEPPAAAPEPAAPAAAAEPPSRPGGESPLSLDDAAEEHEEISIFHGDRVAGRREVTYSREPTTSGQGAVRVRTFDTKLSRGAFQVLDEIINKWLDETGYEAKQVTANIGDIHGKTSIEPHLIINVWY